MNTHKKTLTIAIILSFISVSVIPSTGTLDVEKSSILSSDGNTLYVGGDGPENYTKIQDAIDNASDGDTVFVYNDTYNERLDINKSIDLIGEDRDTTIISLYISFYNTHDILISRFTTWILGFLSVENATIANNNILGNGTDNTGIDIYPCFGNFIISDNVISDWNDDGIYCWYPSRWVKFTIINNIFSDNKFAGLSLDGNGHTIKGNIFINNYFGLSLASDECEIYNNTFKDNKDGLVVTGNSNNIHHNNFIDNKRSAFFVGTLLYNKWEGNYWDKPREYPKPIFGNMGISPWIIIAIGSFLNSVIGRIIPLPLVVFDILILLSFFFCSYFPTWINFDWHPAQEPYDI